MTHQINAAPHAQQTKQNDNDTQSALSVLFGVAAVILLLAGPALVIAAWRWAL